MRHRKHYLRQRAGNDPGGSDEEHVGILEFSTEQATEDVDIEESDVTQTRKNSSASVSGTNTISTSMYSMLLCKTNNTEWSLTAAYKKADPIIPKE